VTEELSQEELEAWHAWDATDRVPRPPGMTEFRRRLRYHQSRWREAHGHPIGTQPIAPRPGHAPRLVGSHLPLEYARETGAAFVTPAALEAARARTAFVERHQSFDHQAFWADLLSSPAMAFNLFGDLAADSALADRAVHAWWPDTPGRIRELRFAHSPGRLDAEWLNSLRAFDTAFVLDLGDGRQGILAASIRYHEWLKPETPKPSNLRRDLEVSDRSGAFAPGATDRVKGRSDLWEFWLEHLLLQSMLQHPSGAWGWGRYVVLHPADNPAIVDGLARYRNLLVDDRTFGSMTLEDLLDAGGLPKRTTAALRERYLPALPSVGSADARLNPVRRRRGDPAKR
jgi:hypothetical protein